MRTTKGKSMHEIIRRGVAKWVCSYVNARVRELNDNDLNAKQELIQLKDVIEKRYLK